ncbi:MAG: Ig-like domain-containing protein [Planctomycetes bacterium]|nr:Ig-like domain-containing protein [Planctomycetota bacterium]
MGARNSMRLRRLFTVILAAAVVAAGCGAPSDSLLTLLAETSGPVVSGMVSKGPVSGATVRLFTVDAAGRVDREIAAAATDGAGRFTMRLPAGAPLGDMLFLRATGGTYADEATLERVTLAAGQEMTAAVTARPGEALTGLVVTPLTHFAATLAGARAGGLTVDNARIAATLVGNHFGVADILRTAPIDAGARTEGGAAATSGAAQYGLLLAALSRLAEDLRAGAAPSLSNPFDLVAALALDVADGRFDGLQPAGGGRTTGVPLAGGALPATAATSSLAAALWRFSGDATRNLSGATASPEIVAALGASDGRLPAPASIAITPAAPVLAVGTSAVLAAQALDDRAAPVANVSFSWSTSDPAVATVDASGLVIGRGIGAVKISATAGGARGEAAVVVLPPVGQPEAVVVTSASPTETTAGETFTVYASGLSPVTAAANAVLFPGAGGTGEDGVAASGDPALTPAYNGRFFSVAVPAGAVTGDTVVRVSHVVGTATVRQTSQPVRVTLLTAAEAAERSPSVTGFTPSSAAPGATVTVTGVNFLPGVTVELRDAAQTSQAITLAPFAVTRGSFAELSFALPSTFDVGDDLEMRALNPTGKSSGFFGPARLRVTSPLPPPADLASGIADVQITASLARTRASGVETVAFTLTLRDAVNKNAGINGATVTFSSPGNGVVNVLTTLPNTKPGVYTASSLAYVPGEHCTVDVTGPTKDDGGAPFRWRQTLLAPGGGVAVSSDGLSLGWAVEGMNDRVVLFRGTTAGASREITGVSRNGVADLTAPVTLVASDYEIAGGASTGTFVARVALRRFAGIVEARDGSFYEIVNADERAITR